MRYCFLLWLVLMTTLLSEAQVMRSDYERLIYEAEYFMSIQEYDKAINKYRSAKFCNKSKANEIDERIATANYLKVMPKIDVNKTSNILPSIKTPKKENKSIISIHVNDFKKEYKEFLDEMEKKDRELFLADVGRLGKANKVLDSLMTFFNVLYDAKNYVTLYLKYSNKNDTTFYGNRFPAKSTEEFEFQGLRILDLIYYLTWRKSELATMMLPVKVKKRYNSRIDEIFKPIKNRWETNLHNYRLPDTVMGLPGKTLFARLCADHKNFVYGYSNYADYKKLQVRFLNVSLPDMTLTKDSSIHLSDSGRFYSIANTSGNFACRIVRGIDYTLKKNLVEYNKIEYPDPQVLKLTDGEGNDLLNLDQYSPTGIFFSPNAMYIATWDDSSQLILYDIKEQKKILLPDSKPAPTESFSADSKTIAYCNKKTQLIYFSDLQGHIQEKIPGRLTGIFNINNIDFTGGNNFLKVNNDDSISLFDIKNRRMIMRFNKAAVSEIIVSPDGANVLLTCNTGAYIADKYFGSSLAVLTDLDLNIKAKLYSSCNTYFFTPEGDYIIGYGESSLMRWPVDFRGNTPSIKTCLSYAEMINYNCLPFSLLNTISAADLLETGARNFKDLAEEELDPRLQSFYFQKSMELFHQLSIGRAKNIRKDRIPFFYDWHSWLERRIGQRNFSDQLIRQQKAVKIFDQFVNSPDSIYPQQLYYAANGYYFMEKLHDSLGLYDSDYVDLIYKEVALRQRVYDKNPDDSDNVYYYIRGLERLSAICDTVGWNWLHNGQYADRLAMHKREEHYLAKKLKVLPDSFNVKTHYVNALAQLAASYLYVHVHRSKGFENSLDSALLYADQGLSYAPNNYDSARLLLVKARAYLLQPNRFNDAMALYRLVRRQFPIFKTEYMLNQLAYLKAAGAHTTGPLKKIEEFLKQND